MHGHLSRLAVADKFKRYSRQSAGRTALLADAQSCSGWGLHGILRYRSIGELLPRLSILTRLPLRFISVALSLKSPSPDVIRHPVLCCSDFPHDVFTPRDRTANSNLLYYNTFLKKNHAFLLPFYKKSSIIIVIFIMEESSAFFCGKQKKNLLDSNRFAPICYLPNAPIS